ncbi:hypothetical protein ScalyP_jg6392, partial [Parmales sp. scaly parma]
MDAMKFELTKMKSFDDGIDAWKMISSLEKDKLCNKHDTDVIPSMWAFKYKTNKEGHVTECKARITQCGNRHANQMSRSDGYSPVLRGQTLRTLISECGADFELDTYDVPLAYLNGMSERCIIMECPPGFQEYDENNNKQYMLLQRNLYGGKDSGRIWADLLSAFLRKNGYHQSSRDSCLYYNSERTVFLVVYVDDLLIASKDPTAKKKITDALFTEFAIKREGPLNWYLGIGYDKVAPEDGGGWKLSQKTFIQSLVRQTNVENDNPVSTPYRNKDPFKVPDSPPSEGEIEALEKSENVNLQQLIGSLLYVSTNTRPDIALAVSRIARYV